MSKEITKAIILQEIQDKLKLREFDPATFLFAETVHPVYNIEQHLEHLKSHYTTVSVTGTGGFLVALVPPDQKWTLSRYDVVFMTGAYTVAGVYTRRAQLSASFFCYLDLAAAQSVSYHVALPVPVTLGPGDSLYVNIDGYTSIGDLRIYYDYNMEEIR